MKFCKIACLHRRGAKTQRKGLLFSELSAPLQLCGEEALQGTFHSFTAMYEPKVHVGRADERILQRQCSIKF